MSSTPHKKNVVENTSIQTDGNIHIGDIYNNKEAEIPHLLTNNIPSNAEHILGRETELQAIITHLAQNKPTVLVNGIGGIGKTSVATKYVANYGHQYKHIAWLTVQSSVAEAFTNDIVLLTSLHIEQDVRQLIETQRLTDAFKLVLHKLNTLDKTLIVLDNANNPDDLIAHKNLFDTAKCHYLITSRTQPQEWTIVEIDHLPPDEAVNLFRKIAPSVSATDEDIKSLLSKLFFHTLLIELVAKAVENTGFAFVELQTMIETKFIHDTQLNEDIVSTGKHGDSVTDNRKRAKIEEYIWLIFSNVKDLSDDAKQILRGMALLPVATPFDRAFLKEHLALFDVKDIVRNLSLLVEWGWLHKEGKGFKMHPLIADVVVEHLEVNVTFAKEYTTRIIVTIDYDNTNPEHNLFDKNKIRFLAERLKNLFFNENTKEIAYLLDTVGTLEGSFGFYFKAIENRERALVIAKNILGKNHSLTLAIQSNLANMYVHVGQYKIAANLLEEALTIASKTFGQNDTKVSAIQSNFANLCQNIGNYSKACDLLKKVLKIELKNLEKEHPRIIIHQINLANAYRNLKNFYQAQRLSENALETALKVFGENHPNISIFQSILGLIYIDLGKHSLAFDLFEKSLKTDINRFGKEHPTIATRQLNLAIACIKTGKKYDAKILLHAAYKNSFRNLGAEHPYTLNIKKRFPEVE